MECICVGAYPYIHIEDLGSGKGEGAGMTAVSRTKVNEGTSGVCWAQPPQWPHTVREAELHGLRFKYIIIIIIIITKWLVTSKAYLYLLGQTDETVSPQPAPR